MIITDDIKNEWEIYSAEQFMKEFNIKDNLDNWACDSELIEHHLEQDKRKFKIRFVEVGNQYTEYWLIQEIK